MLHQAQNHDRKEIPAALLNVILNLSWSVQTRERGNSVVRFRWPPKGEKGSAFRAVSTGVKTDKISKDRQTELVADWFRAEGFIPTPKPAPGQIGLEDEVKEYLRLEYQEKGHPDGTIRPVRQALRRLCEVLSKGIPENHIRPILTVPEITLDVFHAAVPRLKVREKAPRPGQSTFLKPKGWKNLFGNIRAFLRWELTRKTLGIPHLTVDPTIGIATPNKAEI